ncbi:MAG: MBL fold metallo-hydrolase [Corynebacterium sp.]|uniref:MBL fold metallo-hydrolase n=1 Tax=Corynebacterium sp. TaxID=1720 RepID=UPI0026DB0A8B|nr:MBL fold metallo-hydrolase [Corynebacterium sp.]MDO5030729.1 MBL fold metallo-hydrolase [Corynebacterium sp.]
MRLKVLGCTGSMGGPLAPASGYFVELDNGRTFAMDMGPGVLVELQKVADPAACDLLLTHVHPDHTADIPGLLVWRRFHPTAPAKNRNLLVGPGDIHTRIGVMCAAMGNEDDANLDDTFEQIVCHPGESFNVGGHPDDGGAVVTPYSMIHPVPTVGYRIEADGQVFAYSGDSAWTDQLVELARDADVFVCEATWCSNEEGNPPNMHMSGYEAGRAASLAGVKRLVLTHIPPYSDGNEALRAAKTTFDGEVELAYLGMEL